jgi:hypothetical protein
MVKGSNRPSGDERQIDVLWMHHNRDNHIHKPELTMEYRVIVKETVTKMVFVEAPTEPEAGLRVLKGEGHHPESSHHRLTGRGHQGHCVLGTAVLPNVRSGSDRGGTGTNPSSLSSLGGRDHSPGRTNNNHRSTWPSLAFNHSSMRPRLSMPGLNLHEPELHFSPSCVKLMVKPRNPLPP